MAKLLKPDYAGPQTAQRRQWSKLAIAAFVLGLVSGPLVVMNLALLDRYTSPPRNTEESIAVWGTYLLILLANVVALVRLQTMPMHRGRRLAVAGMASTFAWGIGLFLLVTWAVSRI